MGKKYTIVVAAGLSIATLLSQHHRVYTVDIVLSRVNMVNRHKSHI